MLKKCEAEKLQLWCNVTTHDSVYHSHKSFSTCGTEDLYEWHAKISSQVSFVICDRHGHKKWARIKNKTIGKTGDRLNRSDSKTDSKVRLIDSIK